MAYCDNCNNLFEDCDLYKFPESDLCKGCVAKLEAEHDQQVVDNAAFDEPVNKFYHNLQERNDKLYWQHNDLRTEVSKAIGALRGTYELYVDKGWRPDPGPALKVARDLERALAGVEL